MKAAELISSFKELPPNKKLYFASDFHLGLPNYAESKQREKKIIKWLEHVSIDASAIFLVGDVFDFWFEYKHTVPKGFVRFLGKIAELSDQGIPISFFTGNHDLWIREYLPSEIGITVHKNPIVLEVKDKRIFIGHGDGLGPGDAFYKTVKGIFTNPICNWFFQWLHPNIGISIANFWSRKSRLSKGGEDEVFKGEKERLWQFAKSKEKSSHYDYYIFGHRHLPLELPVSDNSTYFNLGEWVNQCTYLEIDGDNAVLKVFEG